MFCGSPQRLQELAIRTEAQRRFHSTRGCPHLQGSGRGTDRLDDSTRRQPIAATIVAFGFFAERVMVRLPCPGSNWPMSPIEAVFERSSSGRTPDTAIIVPRCFRSSFMGANERQPLPTAAAAASASSHRRRHFNPGTNVCRGQYPLFPRQPRVQITFPVHDNTLLIGW